MASKEKNQSIGSFHASQYRNMTIMFVILSLINIATVLLAFFRTGYGLWHAEDALSHVAKITQCVQNVNERALHIVIHSEEREVVKEDVNSIDSSFGIIEAESDQYLQLNLNEIDPYLREEFDDASKKVQAYQKNLKQFTSDLAERRLEGAENISAVYNTSIDPLKSSAETAMNSVFESQNQATYDFFVRCAQQFLFVLLLLLITMTAGILGIRKMKRNAKNAAETIVVEHQKSERSREKVINIAYTNILTGFKNRYGLENDITEMMKSERFSIAVCNYNRFASINESYGRSKADAFISIVSQKLLQQFGEEAMIYSLDADEFCFIFKNDIGLKRVERVVQQIAKTLSRPYDFSDVTIELTAACCYYFCKPGDQASFENLLCTLDRAMAVAKQESRQTGANAIVNVNQLLTN